MSDNVSRRKELFDLLGDLPPRNRKISIVKIDVIHKEPYILEKIYLDLNGIEIVPAYFVKPAGKDNKTPVILYNHAHGGRYDIGKEELIRSRSSLIPYAEELTKLGYSAFCLDTWAFGERQGSSESKIFKKMLWNGQVMWGMMVYDSIRAIDYLETRSDVDIERTATIGMSMGSTMAWWTAALDTRIKVCVDICCMTDFDELIKTDGLDRHGVYYYVPSLLKYFTTSQINALIAPRAHLSLNGDIDRLTPSKGLDKIDRELKEIYKQYDALDKWVMKRSQLGHYETAKMRSNALGFIQKWL